MAKSKTEGPTTNITFLGIELDTVVMIVRLSKKLHCLQKEIRKWAGRRSCSKRELLSLIACVVKPGRSFLRRMITLSTVAKELHHRICLNRGFRLVLHGYYHIAGNLRGVQFSWKGNLPRFCGLIFAEGPFQNCSAHNTWLIPPLTQCARRLKQAEKLVKDWLIEKEKWHTSCI